MLKGLTDYCRSLGLVRTSVWTFARPDTDKYSSLTGDAFLGFGVSATSLLRRQFKINTFSIQGYIDRIEAGHLPTSLTLDFTRRQRAAYFLFWSAYGLVIDNERFRRVIGRSLSAMFRLELAFARAAGILDRSGSDYHLTERGARLYHTVEQVYTTAYIDRMWNISRKQAFPDEIVLK